MDPALKADKKKSKSSKKKSTTFDPEVQDEITMSEISVLGVGDALNFFPSHHDQFFIASDGAAILQLRKFLKALPDSSSLPVRGRDWTPDGNLTPWEYGYAVKTSEVLFFLYESGKVESFGIDDLNFRDLVHIAKVKSVLPPPPKVINPDNVVIISHGWSERIGPNYPLIRTLEKVAWWKGWKVVIPDFRAAYKYGSSRGRSERVKILYEEIICLDPKPKTLVLVGHSQGGAASATACRDRVVDAANIKGLLLMGSENPGSLDGMNWKPKVQNLLFVHAENDQTITIGENESIAKHWGAPYIKVQSKVPIGEKNMIGDDINHDFLTKELMESATEYFCDFLDLCLGQPYYIER